LDARLAHSAAIQRAVEILGSNIRWFELNPEDRRIETAASKA